MPARTDRALLRVASGGEKVTAVRSVRAAWACRAPAGFRAPALGEIRADGGRGTLRLTVVGSGSCG